jgi:hypothetical protein
VPGHGVSTIKMMTVARMNQGRPRRRAISTRPDTVEATTESSLYRTHSCISETIPRQRGPSGLVRSLEGVDKFDGEYRRQG